MRPVEEIDFARELSALDLSQADLAVALLWFRSKSNQGLSVAASELGSLIHGYALTGPPNTSRLKGQLALHPATVKGDAPNTVKLKLSYLSKLDEKFGSLTASYPPKVSYLLLPESQTNGTRRYLEKIALQLNGCYEAGFYDGCAVMQRRLIESLLIEVFEKKGQGDAIKFQRAYVGFGDIVGITNSGKFVKLARGANKALERIKAVGDTAAHDRTYLTSKLDIEDIAHDFRRLVSELMEQAEIRASH